MLLNLCIESLIGRVPMITQIFERIRLCFRTKVRFSLAFLASHGINQKQRMQKYTCRGSWHPLKFPPLHLVSSFWLSGHLFLAMQFISEFIWVNVRGNALTWQAKTIILCFFTQAHDQNTAHANQSVPLDCRIADLWAISVSRVPICDTDYIYIYILRLQTALN